MGKHPTRLFIWDISNKSVTLWCFCAWKAASVWGETAWVRSVWGVMDEYGDGDGWGGWVWWWWMILEPSRTVAKTSSTTKQQCLLPVCFATTGTKAPNWQWAEGKMRYWWRSGDSESACQFTYASLFAWVCMTGLIFFFFPLVLQLFTNRTACQALGNMCVLNMHSSSTISNDACGLYNTIYRATAAQGNNQGNPYWYATILTRCKVYYDVQLSKNVRTQLSTFLHN